jgi:sugar phosphate isomerase/epimerase
VGNVALQLYSVRDHTEKDFLGTIKKVAEMGYDAVQFAGFFDTPALEVKAVLEECSLKVAGAHIGIDLLTEDKMEETLRYQRMIGNDLIICPWLPEEMRDSKEAYQRTAERLNQIGE